MMVRWFAPLLLAAACSSAAAQADDDWKVLIRQGASAFELPATGPVTLKKAPFSLEVTTAKDVALAVMGSVDCMWFADIRTGPQLGKLVTPGLIGAESEKASENTWLAVNLESEFVRRAATALAWAEDDESETHSYQQTRQEPDGRLTGVRRIETIVMRGASHREVPVAKYPHDQICLIAASMVPAEQMDLRKPRLIQIRFE